jgi:hypothetical protein
MQSEVVVSVKNPSATLSGRQAPGAPPPSPPAPPAPPAPPCAVPAPAPPVEGGWPPTPLEVVVSASPSSVHAPDRPTNTALSPANLRTNMSHLVRAHPALCDRLLGSQPVSWLPVRPPAALPKTGLEDEVTSQWCVPPIGHGTVINDRYDIRQSLGKGGMGEVFLAYDRSTQQTVALKVVREESRMPGDDEALAARAAARPRRSATRTSAACTIWRPSRWGPILVMEHIPGQTLHTHIRRKKGPGRVHLRRVPQDRQEVCAGLAAIHAQGLVHGDLKPGNVMVTEGQRVILDFGFAAGARSAAARRPAPRPTAARRTT